MSAALPPHVATADEPIPTPGDAPLRNEPDMREAMPIAEMLAALRVHDGDDVGYVELWRLLLQSVGNSVCAEYDRDGTLRLVAGGPVDAQMRHRSRWQHFLAEDLDRLPGRRELLLATLVGEGIYSDNRPVDPAATTRAVRAFLRTGGRLLVDPSGRLTEGAELPPSFRTGSLETCDEIARASRAYYQARRRWRADRQIKRAVTLLGKPTANGWMVLEARS